MKIKDFFKNTMQDKQQQQQQHQQHQQHQQQQHDVEIVEIIDYSEPNNVLSAWQDFNFGDFKREVRTLQQSLRDYKREFELVEQKFNNFDFNKEMMSFLLSTDVS
jgi:hypothetical protein